MASYMELTLADCSLLSVPVDVNNLLIFNKNIFVVKKTLFRCQSYTKIL